MDKSQIIAKIKDVASKVLPQGSKLILFGSQARGSARPDSDWDIIILVKRDHITAIEAGDIAYPFYSAGWEMKVEINPVIYTFKDWQKRHFTPFYHNVSIEGIQLWG
jgi:uncharacterized protein